MSISPHDPRLTAYACDELTPDDRAEIERAIASQPEIAEEVAALRSFTDNLRSALSAEGSPALDDEARQSILEASASSKPRRMPLYLAGVAAVAMLVFAQVLVFRDKLVPTEVARFDAVPEKRKALKSVPMPDETPADQEVFVVDGMPLSNPPARPELRTEEPIVVRNNAAPETVSQDRGKSDTDGPLRSYRSVVELDIPKEEVYGALDGNDIYLGRNEALREAVADEPVTTEAYDKIEESGFRSVIDDPLSTFSIDVDTASYSNVRRFIEQGSLPPIDAVRIEELINYFPYNDPEPTGGQPFAVGVEVAAAPWAPDHRLMRVGIKARGLDEGNRPPCNLVFLIDVSGSMNSANKLPLLIDALSLLVDNLDDADTVSIVAYAGSDRVVLEPTKGWDRHAIREALEQLQAGGSTHGAGGIQRAYALAQTRFVDDGVNRVILATDGDFNVGVSDRGSLIRMVEARAAEGIDLTVLGFGMGNLKDSTLEQLADKGNGNYAYIDTIEEARKVLVEEVGGTLVTIARDVKIQVEMNPTEVSAWRLIGYENRKLAHADFNDDTKDAGEVGAGHSITVLYELIPTATAGDVAPMVDPLKYQRDTEPSNAAFAGELLTVKLRYKETIDAASKLIEVPVRDRGRGLTDASDDLRFAAAVAGFGMILRQSEHHGDLDLETVIELAIDATGYDPAGYRAGFLRLLEKARPLLETRR